jgi:hypothetical protein
LTYFVFIHQEHLLDPNPKNHKTFGVDFLMPANACLTSVFQSDAGAAKNVGLKLLIIVMALIES